MSEYAIVDHAGVVSNLTAFFTGIGWTVTGTALNPIVAPIGGTKSYSFTATADGINVFDTTDNTFRARMYPPIEVATAAATFAAPTRLFAFGETDWAALVIQYGANSYRHIYLGVLNKVGSYTGGDIVACNNSFGVTYATNSINSSVICPLFAQDGVANYTTTTFPTYTPQENGAVYLSHLDLTSTVKKYGLTRTYTVANLGDDRVFGAGQPPEETDRRMAQAPVPGGVVLVPFNHYVTNGYTTNKRVIPIGFPKGVRGTSLRDLAPEETRVVGVDTWQFFPEFSKTNSRTETRAVGDTYTKGKNSFYLGVAYKVVG